MCTYTMRNNSIVSSNDFKKKLFTGYKIMCEPSQKMDLSENNRGVSQFGGVNSPQSVYTLSTLQLLQIIHLQSTNSIR